MMPESIIRSRQNSVFKQVRSLLRRDRRHQERAFLVEGPRFIADAQQFGAHPIRLVLSESFASSAHASEFENPNTWIFDDTLFASISDTVTSQGMIGIFSFPDLTPPANEIPFILILDGVQDPGNLGTLLRSSAAAGVTQVITLPGTSDPWAPKTVRAAAAAHFVVPITAITPDMLDTALPAGITIIGTEAGSPVSYDRIDLTGPIALVIGSEGHGLSKSIRDRVDELISIPLANEFESLNAAVAGSIVLFETHRQRRNLLKL